MIYEFCRKKLTPSLSITPRDPRPKGNRTLDFCLFVVEGHGFQGGKFETSLRSHQEFYSTIYPSHKGIDASKTSRKISISQTPELQELLAFFEKLRFTYKINKSNSIFVLHVAIFIAYNIITTYFFLLLLLLLLHSMVRILLSFRLHSFLQRFQVVLFLFFLIIINYKA